MIFEGARSLTLAYHNPLVIKSIAAIYEINQVLVDTGRSIDVIFYECFLKLGLQDKYMSMAPYPSQALQDMQCIPRG